MKKSIYLTIILLTLASTAFPQGFLHVNNKNIVDGNGDRVLLRGIGLGGWMLQEGYMMKTSAFAGAQYQIKAKIEALVGAANTTAFYEAWLENYIQKADVDSLKAWGFNSIRLPMHYNLYTLPIENEPVKGQNTWLDRGFELTDRLLQWCSDNEIYLILDLHGAPGGQGKEASISDYNPAKPSLWESADNRAKTVALWARLAERYANEPWIGGYDLINETNWTLTNNRPLRELYVAITNAIRQVDTNHIIYIEGNWFANDFTGLTPPWDDNMVYSFHKYWNYNNQAAIQWVLDLRNSHNVPIWCGEAGENSNPWFTDAISLLEKNNIGWAWWPYKKIEDIAGPLSVRKSAGYDRLLNYWSGSASKPSTDFALAALMELAENLKLENCIYQKDVPDAMIRQVGTTATKPFARNDIPGLIFATEYDLGQNGYAYFDEQVADYHVSTNERTDWNNGWIYRNDGVDIEACTDGAASNGYNVGWIAADEWLAFTVNVEETAAYDVTLRTAAQSATGRLHIEVDERPVSKIFSVKNSGGWQNWTTVTTDGIILEQGQHVVKLYFDAAGFNLNFAEFDNPRPTSEVSFDAVAATITDDGAGLTVFFNKKLAEPLPVVPGGFSARTGEKNIAISSYNIDASGYQLVLDLSEPVYYEDRVYVSYTGQSVKAQDASLLAPFTDLAVKNTLQARHAIPGRIQAEDFSYNFGLELESTTDTGGGQNLGYTNAGDYVDYLVTVRDAGLYNVDYRIASLSTGGRIDLQKIDASGTETLHTAVFPATGGWQTWRTITQPVTLPAGRYTLRIRVRQGEFNLNWFSFTFVTAVNEKQEQPISYELAQNYPNPFNPQTTIRYAVAQPGLVRLVIYNLLAEEVETLVNEFHQTGRYEITWNAVNYPSGLYFYTLHAGDFKATRKLVLCK